MKRYYIPLLFVVLIFYYIWGLNTLPITAYDESYYAEVIEHTLQSGQFLTLYGGNGPWFEKPPLYLWASMGTLSLFGDHEWAYRIVSVVMAIFGIFFTYLFAKLLSGNKKIAVLAAVILACFPLYYLSSRQIRLDVPLSTVMLISMWAFARGWRKPNYLFWSIFLIGVGFMIKNIAVLSVIFIMLTFAFVYKKWDWLKRKQTWWGALGAMVFILPWHLQQYLVWGSTFWNNYVGFHLITRFSDGYGGVDASDPFGYIKRMHQFAKPWWHIFILSLVPVLVLSKKVFHSKESKLFWASSISVVIVFILFSISSTKVTTYLVPILPYIAISVAILVYQIFVLLKLRVLKVLLALMVALLISYSVVLSVSRSYGLLGSMHMWADYDLKNMGLLIREDGNPSASIYRFSGPPLETLSFYSKLSLSNWSIENDKIFVKGPAYMFMTEPDLQLFFKNGEIKKEYENVKSYYINNGLVLLYTDEDIVLDLKP